MLHLVSSSPEFFAHSGDAPIGHGEAFGCNCANCGRSISAPFGFENRLIWCLYCGMENGHVPMVENPFGHRYSFGVTREECREDFAALERGDFFEVIEARARREGRLLDLLG